MTKVHTWTLTGIAVLALAAGALLVSGAMSFAQSPTPTPSPGATEDAGDEGTPTPSPSDEDAGEQGEDDAGDTEDDADPNGDDAEGSKDDDEDSGRRGCGPGGKYAIKGAAAEALGISEEELLTALSEGQSLAQIAEAQGMSVQDFRAALLENVTADLQARLDAGEITQEQFDEKVAELNANIDEIINAEGGLRFRGPRGGGEEEGETGGVRFRRGVIPNFDA
jgi:hypothetical protein